MASPLSDAVILDIEKTLDELGRKGVARIRPLIKSNTLSHFLDYRISIKKTVFRLEFFVPHYWAPIYHDGRGPIVTTGVMVFYRNPDDDPRIKLGHPSKKSEVRHLSRTDFKKGLETNREMFKDFPDGGKQQFMVITNSVGPAVGFPFFTIGLRGFGNTIRKAIKRKIVRRLKTSIDVKTRQVILRL